MKNKKFVFDTNFYRAIASEACINLNHYYLNNNGIKKIKEMPYEMSDEFKPFIDEIRKIIHELKIKENKKSIKVYPNIVVLAELMYHLVKSTDDNKQKCILAIIAVAEHIDEENKYNYYATAEAILAKEMFGMYHSNADEGNQEAIDLLFKFKTDGIELILLNNQDRIENIASYITRKEENFLNNAEGFIRNFDENFCISNDGKWQIFKNNKDKREEWHQKKLGENYKKFVENNIAYKGLIITFIERIANYLGINTNLPENCSDNQAYELLIKAINGKSSWEYYGFIAQYCCPQLELLRLQIAKLVQGVNLNKSKQLNFIHDIDIMFSIIAENVILVSDDNEMTNAVLNVNEKYKIMKSAEYREILLGN